MQEQKIYEGFDNWSELQRLFETDAPEPEEVFFAYYDGGGYEGWSTVAYRDKDTYFINDASHCSCYGLEGTWDPTAFQGVVEFVTYLKRWCPTDESTASAKTELISKLESRIPDPKKGEA